MFVKISVLIESGDWVLRTGLSGAGAGGEHLHPDFSLSVSAAPQLAGLQEERWLDWPRPSQSTKRLYKRLLGPHSSFLMQINRGLAFDIPVSYNHPRLRSSTTTTAAEPSTGRASLLTPRSHAHAHGAAARSSHVARLRGKYLVSPARRRGCTS